MMQQEFQQLDVCVVLMIEYANTISMSQDIYYQWEAQT